MALTVPWGYNPRSMCPSVSVIICTRNRAPSLKRTLDRLLHLNVTGVERFEVVVVDNGSEDSTPEIIALCAAVAPFTLRYVHEPQPGLSVARNTGLRAADGDLIMFTDDDCLADRDWVYAALGAFNGNLLQIVGGRVDLHDPTHLDVTTRSGNSVERLQSASSLLGFMHGANMAFGRSVVDAIGYFDKRLGAGSALKSAEDIDFICRAFTMGIPIVFHPTVVVSHDHGRIGLKAHRRLLRGYYIGAGAAAAKQLLDGRSEFVKILYWDIRAAARSWKSGRITSRDFLLRRAFITGAGRFIAISCWKRSE